jgi:membrane-bound lytic murein transglycosylase A
MKQKHSDLKKLYSLLAGIILTIQIFFLSGCYQAVKREITDPENALKEVNNSYPQFSDDMDFESLSLAIQKNLEYLDRLDPDYKFSYGPEEFTCRQIREGQEAFQKLISGRPDIKTLNDEIKNKFFVYRAAGKSGGGKVLFTGYYEPVLEASTLATGPFIYPLYRVPDDLIKVDLSIFNKKFKGETIIARIEGNKVLPYYSRKQIEDEKALQGRDLELAWLKDPVDVAFLQIQGSGKLKFQSGDSISVGYQAANGQPYNSIGKYMIEKGYLRREEVSMQAIRSYLVSHPEIINEVLNYNQSYVFFRVLDNGPLGNIQVPLTAGRSIATDSRLFPKGALCFLSSEKPVINDLGEIQEWTGFSRFVLNQDTGGAIKGAGRADIFWGNGKYAEIAAGYMKNEGELYFLIKKP